MAAPRRRLTGKNRNRVSQLSESPPNPMGLQRSATTKVTNGESPKLPLPYLPRKPELPVETKRLSGSGENSFDVCSKIHLLLLTGSREGSAISEEEDGGAYESVDDFLRRDSSGAIIIGPPPSYVPSRQGGKRPDHDYTPVKMEGGEVQRGHEAPQEDIWGKSPIAKKRPSVGGTSPQQQAPQLPPFGTSPSTRPVPVTPPPSPPTPRVAGRVLEDTGEKRPTLPPKRRRSAPYSEPDTSKWRGSPPKIPAPVQVSASLAHFFFLQTNPACHMQFVLKVQVFFANLRLRYLISYPRNNRCYYLLTGRCVFFSTVSISSAHQWSF